MRATQIIYGYLKKEPWFTVLGMDQQWDFCNNFLKKVNVMHCILKATLVISLARAYARAEGFVVD